MYDNQSQADWFEGTLQVNYMKISSVAIVWAKILNKKLGTQDRKLEL